MPRHCLPDYLLIFLPQVAIVTGGGQGLGEGIAKMLSDNGAAMVVIFDIMRRKDKL